MNVQEAEKAVNVAMRNMSCEMGRCSCDRNRDLMRYCRWNSYSGARKIIDNEGMCNHHAIY